VLNVTTADNEVSVAVVGAQHEVVVMSFARVNTDGVPTGTILTASVELPSSGLGVITVRYYNTVGIYPYYELVP
jgi:hypothetical protein